MLIGISRLSPAAGVTLVLAKSTAADCCLNGVGNGGGGGGGGD